MGLNNIVITALPDSERADDVARLVSGSHHSVTYYQSLESLWATDSQTPRVVVVCVPEEDPEKALLQHEFANREGLPVSFCYCVENTSLPFVVQAVRQGAVDVFDHNVSRARFDEILFRAASLLTVRQEQIQQIRIARAYVSGLSQRQRELLPLLLCGYTNKAAAAEMEISIKTVEKHRQIIIRKAQVGNLVEIAKVFSTSQQSIAEASAYTPSVDRHLAFQADRQGELV